MGRAVDSMTVTTSRPIFHVFNLSLMKDMPLACGNDNNTE